MDTVHVVLSVHVCTNVYPEFLLYSNVHHLMRPFENPLLLLLLSSSSSSSSSSSMLTYVFGVHLEDECCRVSIQFCNGSVLAGNGISSVGVSSSSEELKVVKCHTGLQCDCLVPVLHGVTSSKEAFSTLETWWILEVLLSGVGMLKFLLPLLYPLSSNASLLSNAALSLVTKQPKNISSDYCHSRCVDVK